MALVQNHPKQSGSQQSASSCAWKRTPPHRTRLLATAAAAATPRGVDGVAYLILAIRTAELTRKDGVGGQDDIIPP